MEETKEVGPILENNSVDLKCGKCSCNSVKEELNLLQSTVQGMKHKISDLSETVSRLANDLALLKENNLPNFETHPTDDTLNAVQNSLSDREGNAQLDPDQVNQDNVDPDHIQSVGGEGVNVGDEAVIEGEASELNNILDDNNPLMKDDDEMPTEAAKEESHAANEVVIQEDGIPSAFNKTNPSSDVDIDDHSTAKFAKEFFVRDSQSDMPAQAHSDEVKVDQHELNVKSAELDVPHTGQTMCNDVYRSDESEGEDKENLDESHSNIKDKQFETDTDANATRANVGLQSSNADDSINSIIQKWALKKPGICKEAKTNCPDSKGTSKDRMKSKVNAKAQSPPSPWKQVQYESSPRRKAEMSPKFNQTANLSAKSLQKTFFNTDAPEFVPSAVLSRAASVSPPTFPPPAVSRPALSSSVSPPEFVPASMSRSASVSPPTYLPASLSRSASVSPPTYLPVSMSRPVLSASVSPPEFAPTALAAMSKPMMSASITSPDLYPLAGLSRPVLSAIPEENQNPGVRAGMCSQVYVPINYQYPGGAVLGFPQQFAVPHNHNIREF